MLGTPSTAGLNGAARRMPKARGVQGNTAFARLEVEAHRMNVPQVQPLLGGRGVGEVQRQRGGRDEDDAAEPSCCATATPTRELRLAETGKNMQELRTP